MKAILSAQEELVLKTADEIYYLDWRENDDDEKTAGWRHPGYFTEVNVSVDFSKLVDVGLMEHRDGTPQTKSYRISEVGRAYVGAGRRWENLKKDAPAPEVVLDDVLGILTGFPSEETSQMDALGVAQDKMNEIMTYRNRIRLAGRIINSTIGILDGMRAEGQAMADHPLLNAARGNLEETIDALNGVHEPKP